MTTYNKPLPKVTAVSAPFWDGLKNEKLLVQKCMSCGNVQHPAMPHCVSCWKEDLEWVEHSGTGEIYSYSVCHWPTIPAFKQDAPYVVAIIELQDGIRINSNIVDCKLDDLRVGMPVTAIFDHVTSEASLIKFRPV
jgi:uncharacterized OB-fold protein